MAKQTYGEIPDDFPNKPYMPLHKRLFPIYQELVWHHVISKFDEVASKFTSDNFSSLFFHYLSC